MSHIKTPRPMTHDLIINIIRNLRIKIANIEISDIRDNTFYAIINIRNLDKSLIKIDSRPCKCDIFAAEHVLDSGGLVIQSIDEEVDKFKDFLEHIKPDDFNK